jgi:hypothetical protein
MSFLYLAASFIISTALGAYRAEEHIPNRYNAFYQQFGASLKGINTEEQDNLIYQILPDGSRKLVGVSIGDIEIREKIRKDPNELEQEKNTQIPPMPSIPDQPGFPSFFDSPYRIEIRYKYINPLAKLTDKEIAGLRTINVLKWNGNHPEKFKYINPESTKVSIAGESQKDILQYLPEDIRYLSVTNCFNPDNIKSLKRFSKLKCLNIGSIEPEFDLSLIIQNKGLEHLHFGLDYNDIENLDKIGGFSKLKVLSMPEFEELEDISFVKNLKQLEYLDISESKVSDLSCLNALKHLEYIKATASPIEKLPEKMPALKIFKAMGNKLSPEQIAEFKHNNPGCIFVYNWNDSIHDLLAPTTKIELDDCFESDAKPFLSVTNPEDVAEFIENLEFDPQERDVSTLCMADACIRFYHNDDLLETFEIVCDDHFRWKDASPQEICLTLKSGDFFAAWIDRHGESGESGKREKTKQKEAESYARFESQFYELLDLLPQDVAGILKEDYESKEQTRKQAIEELSPDIARMINEHGVYDNTKATILNHYTNKEELSILCFDILSRLDRKMYFSFLFNQILRDIEPLVLQKGVNMLLQDNNSMKGICIWFFGMHGFEKLDADFLEGNLEKITLTALKNAPDRGDRMHIIYCLGRIDTGSSRTILREILHGRIFDKLEPAIDKPEERNYAMLPLSQNISYQAQAAEALAKLNDTESLPYIRELHSKADPNDTGTYERALEMFTNYTQSGSGL